MTDGQVLRQFIDNQHKSKISIAKGLGVSKQTLFNYFKSKEISPEIKGKLEDYFDKVIFTSKAAKEIGKNNFSKIMDIVNNERAKPVTFINEEVVEGLRAQIRQLEEHNRLIQRMYEDQLTHLATNLNSLKETLKNDSENLKLVMKEVSVSFHLMAEMMASVDKKTAQQFRDRFDNMLTFGQK
jgi:AcrR family transcriptional regulator